MLILLLVRERRAESRGPGSVPGCLRPGQLHFPSSGQRQTREPGVNRRQRQMTFFPRTVPEWKSLPQEVTTAPTPNSKHWFTTSFRRKVPESDARSVRPPLASSRPGSTRSLASQYYYEKWVSEGCRGGCAGRGSSPGTATVAGLV